MNRNEHKTFIIWRDKVIKTQDISPLKFGMSQEEVKAIFGEPDTISTMEIDGKPLILKYHDIEFHFDERFNHTLYLVYSDYKVEISIMTECTESVATSVLSGR